MALALAYGSLGVGLGFAISLFLPKPEKISYQGGPVEHNPGVRVIYWGPQWLGNGLGPIKVAVARFFQLLPGSNYQNIIAQYSDKTGKVGLNPKLVATYIDPTKPSGTITRSGVGSEVNRVARLMDWPSGINQQYVVLGEQGAKTDDPTNNDCGYHDSTQKGKLTYIYDFIPYEGDSQGCADPNDMQSVVSNTTETLGHEVAEAMTDPLSSAWFSSDSQNEMADLCESDGDIGTMNALGAGVDVNPLWDLTRHTCTTDLPRPVGEKLSVSAVSQTGDLYDIDAQVKFPVFIPGDTATVFLRGVGYDARNVNFETTSGCPDSSGVVDPEDFRYQFACHSRLIEVAGQVRAVAANIPNMERAVFLNVRMVHNGVEAVSLKQPPAACTQSVGLPGYASIGMTSNSATGKCM